MKNFNQVIHQNIGHILVLKVVFPQVYLIYIIKKKNEHFFFFYFFFFFFFLFFFFFWLFKILINHAVNFIITILYKFVIKIKYFYFIFN